MQAPEFWARRSWLSAALDPLAKFYDQAGRLRRTLASPSRVPVPVICVGNLVVGGAGKTPVVLALAALAAAHGLTPHLLTRGYRGRLRGPVAVDPSTQDFRAVGDEALLLAEAAPSWVSRNRAAGARAAVAAGAGLVIMDDGLQNLDLQLDLALLVVDGGFGFGNGQVLPAGPLREPVARGMARAKLAIVIGEDRVGVGATISRHLPVAQGRIVPLVPERSWSGRRVVAFAGIGRPQKFFETLADLGTDLIGCIAFPDHHPYTAGQIIPMLEQAAQADAVVVTTAKDWVRVPPALRARVERLPVRLAWDRPEDERLILSLLCGLVER